MKYMAGYQVKILFVINIAQITGVEGENFKMKVLEIFFTLYEWMLLLGVGVNRSPRAESVTSLLPPVQKQKITLQELKGRASATNFGEFQLESWH